MFRDQQCNLDTSLHSLLAMDGWNEALAAPTFKSLLIVFRCLIKKQQQQAAWCQLSKQTKPRHAENHNKKEVRNREEKVLKEYTPSCIRTSIQLNQTAFIKLHFNSEHGCLKASSSSVRVFPVSGSISAALFIS